MSQEIENKKKQTLKVIELGLEKDVQEGLRNGWTITSITKSLNTNGHQIDYQSVRKYVLKNKEVISRAIQENVKIANEYRKVWEDYNGAITDILDEVKEVKNLAKDEKEYITYNALIGRLLQGIELLAKISGDINPQGKIDINLIYSEILEKEEERHKNEKTGLFKKEIDIDEIIKKEDEKNTGEINEGKTN